MRRHGKYNAKKTKVDGIVFDSKAESKRYQELKLLEKARMISRIELQPRFILVEGYINGNGKKIRPIHYVADFRYIDMKSGIEYIEDVKGTKTQVYLLKKKLFEKRYYPLTITEIE